jgi:hypothetical protein
MKKSIFILSFIISFYLQGNTQSNNLNTTGKWGTQIFLSDANGRAFVNKYADVIGSAYLFPVFRFSSIELTDGRKFINIKSRLNLVEQEVEFISASGQEGYIGKGMVKRISYADTTKKEIKIYSFETGYPKIDNQTFLNFYQVLSSGKCLLLKAINKNIEDRNNELSGERSKEFIVREDLYMVTKGEIRRVKKDKDFILGLLSDQTVALNNYINEKKPNFRNESDLAQLISYYNTL